MPVKNQLQGMIAVFEPLDRALAHKPAFLNLLFNKDNLDFWFDS
jgi:hypothetical protein